MYEIKKKVSVIDSYRHKVQMLTRTPELWTHKKISNYFKVSEYLVRTLKQVKNEQAILSLPGKKIGNPISQETVKLVINFHQSDEF